ncbi:hypothetical protein E2C01_023063 [Portunus trituberculatus]|uniref:Uncharacterized protein n=1 Tax=Portunus trituberculatus TaxID=210409 RepID=A0A5B7EA59_PORTR|nr:hypothetical protein [Portunus trituberculatus]
MPMECGQPALPSGEVQARQRDERRDERCLIKGRRNRKRRGKVHMQGGCMVAWFATASDIRQLRLDQLLPWCLRRSDRPLAEIEASRVTKQAEDSGQARRRRRGDVSGHPRDERVEHGHQINKPIQGPQPQSTHRTLNPSLTVSTT